MTRPPATLPARSCCIAAGGCVATAGRDNTDESNDEIRMSNDELMTKREMARGEQVPTSRDSPPSLGLRRYGLSDSTTDDPERPRRQPRRLARESRE
jgi:hypothetical protein